MTARKILFWIHLTAGVTAGVVILILSVTGILLSFERQMKKCSDRAYKVSPRAERAGLGPIVVDARKSQGKLPTLVRESADPTDPLELGFEGDFRMLIDPYTGAVLWQGRDPVYHFFSAVEAWHWWLGASGGSKSWQRNLTGAANFVFLILLASGPFLWWRNLATWKRLKNAIWFRRNLAGRVRHLNWHDVAGGWCVAPLFVVSLTGVLMSYAWATNLLYRMTGTTPVSEGRLAADRGRQPGSVRQHDASADFDWNTLDPLFVRAASQVTGWRTITLRLPLIRNAANFVIETGGGGRPDQRSQLALNAQTGEVVRWESFSTYNLGRRLRGWARFAHNGEAAGIAGQILGLLACLGSVLLVWSGLSLAIGRYLRWRTRSQTEEARELVEEEASSPR